MIILPNTVADGYQTHICVNVQKKNKTSNNWLTNLHNQQVKKLIIEKEIKMSPNAKVSKNNKRKRSYITSYNNLNKYFKKSNENFMTKM